MSWTRPLPLRCARVALQPDCGHCNGQGTAGRAVMLAWCTHTRRQALQLRRPSMEMAVALLTRIRRGSAQMTSLSLSRL